MAYLQWSCDYATLHHEMDMSMGYTFRYWSNVDPIEASLKLDTSYI